MNHEGHTSTRTVDIDFLFLDLETCTRCKGTDANISEALNRVGSVLEGAGVQVRVQKTLVDSEKKARDLNFISSPTIRVNGRDIALDLRESACDTCGEACGSNGNIDCRVWFYQGEEYTEAPIPLVMDAILSEAYSGRTALVSQTEPKPEVPENLKRFYASKAAKGPAPCCGEEKQASCCEPSEKGACCAPGVEKTKSGGCGCQ